MVNAIDQGWYVILVRREGRHDFTYYTERDNLRDAIAAARTWLIGQAVPCAAKIIDLRKPLDSPCEWLSMAQRGERAMVRREEVVA